MQFIRNPRCSPRAPARCRAALSLAGGGSWRSETEDIGALGCQVTAPRAVANGAPLVIVVESERLPEPLKATARIAWVGEWAPWRVGIAFDAHLFAATSRWFERLLAAHPGLATFRRVPDRIAFDATIYLGLPPRLVVDFTADEAAVLRSVASGITAGELRARFGASWPATQRAMFSLLARRLLTLSRGAAAHPASWARILADLETSLAADPSGDAAPAPEPRPPPPPSAPAWEATTPSDAWEPPAPARPRTRRGAALSTAELSLDELGPQPPRDTG